MCVAYVCQALDKGTTGTMSIMGWQANIGAKGQDYALTSTLLWVGIIIGEPIVSGHQIWTAKLCSCQGESTCAPNACCQDSRRIDVCLDSRELL